MLKRIFFIPLLMCTLTTTLKALNDNFDTTLYNAEQIAKEITFDLKNKNHQTSLQTLKQLTIRLVSQLRTLPNYVQQQGDTLFIEIGFPSTSGITIWKNKISKKAFFDDVKNIEKISQQAANKEQFSEIINLLNKVFAYFNISLK